MAQPKKPKDRARSRVAMDPANREGQLINLAVNLAEKQMYQGNAAAPVIVHFLKLGTEREKLERAKIEYETELVRAKVEALRSAERTEVLYQEAIEAMRSYSGRPTQEVEYDENENF